MPRLVIGVLALQGAFSKHLDMLKRVGVEGREVRKPADLRECAGLIIPGGESTTILRQLWFIELFEALIAFSQEKPLFGTCAGLILMSREIVANTAMKPLGVLDVAVERNAFGRQAESFSTSVDLSLAAGKKIRYPAVFIRAPRICHAGPAVKVLSTYEGEPVLVQQGRHLAATFHPELTDDPTIHDFFVSIAKKK